MPITSGTQLDLDDGQREEIISDDTTENAFIVEVIGQNPIRVDHRKQYAADGTTLSAGQTHTVSNLRGQKLYAAAYDGATSIRVRDASADVKSQPQREVSVVGDVTVGSNINVEELSPNGSGVSAFTQSISGSTTLDSVTVPNGFNAVVLADSDNGDDVLIDSSFPLSAGDAVSLSVSDTANVSVDVASGTQTVHVITEVA